MALKEFRIGCANPIRGGLCPPHPPEFIRQDEAGGGFGLKSPEGETTSFSTSGCRKIG